MVQYSHLLKYNIHLIVFCQCAAVLNSIPINQLIICVFEPCLTLGLEEEWDINDCLIQVIPWHSNSVNITKHGAYI